LSWGSNVSGALDPIISSLHGLEDCTHEVVLNQDEHFIAEDALNALKDAISGIRGLLERLDKFKPSFSPHDALTDSILREQFAKLLGAARMASANGADPLLALQEAKLLTFHSDLAWFLEYLERESSKPDDHAVPGGTAAILRPVVVYDGTASAITTTAWVTNSNIQADYAVDARMLLERFQGAMHKSVAANNRYRLLQQHVPHLPPGIATQIVAREHELDEALFSLQQRSLEFFNFADTTSSQGIINLKDCNWSKTCLRRRQQFSLQHAGGTSSSWRHL